MHLLETMIKIKNVLIVTLEGKGKCMIWYDAKMKLLPLIQMGEEGRPT